MKKPLLNLLLLTILAACVSAHAQVTKLVPLPTFGTNGDGTIRADQVDWLNSSSDAQRGMAWNPTTGHVLLVCRTNAFSPTYYRVMILDGQTGQVITNGDGSPKQLDLSSLVQGGGNGSFLISLIGVADDGAIYAANLSNSQTPAQVALYRWDNEDAQMNFVWLGDPASGIGGAVNRRWGDTFTVRGAGLNTEVLMASRGTVACLFRPNDVSMSSFYPTTLQTDTGVGALGYGLCFGAGSTFWGTSGGSLGGPLFQLSYDPNAGTATTITTLTAASGAFPATVAPLAVLTSSNLLAGIDVCSSNDITRLYDISGLPNAPVLFDRQYWPSNTANSTASGALAFSTNGLLYALDADNGLAAYYLTNTAATPFAPTITLQPNGRTAVIGSNIVLNAASDGDAPVTYQWRFKASTNGSVTVNITGANSGALALNNVQLTNSGGYSFIASNAYGIVTSLVAQVNIVSAPQAVYEAFAYPVGAILTGQQNPFSFQKWVLNSGTAGTIEAGGLNYPGLPASTGNRFTWGSASMSERLPIGTNVSGTLFFSFLLKVADVGSFSTSDTIAGFGQVINDTAFSGKLNITSNGFQTYQLGLYKGGGTGNGAVAPMTFTTNDTVMVIGNYTFNQGSSTDDSVSLWLNPDPITFGSATPPPPTVGPVTAGNDVSLLSYFFFRATTSPRKKIADELRVGYTWADVTPKAPPTLAISPSGGNAVVTWPYYETDFQLQSCTNLSSPQWANVTNSVSMVNSNFTATVPLGGGNKFFRLIQ